ncbi:Tetratricopeptide repeat protein 1 [Bienertia sinuspersici]
MKEPQTSKRKNKLSNLFKDMPKINNENNIINMITGLWNMAMAQPNDPELPSLGIFECMAKLIQKGVNDREWLLKGQNIYIPYYAAHIIGSYTMNKPDFAVTAVKSGIIPPLMELMRGKLSWVEQRVAVRALGHLASYEATFDAVSEYQEEVIALAMEISSTCIDVVYQKFVAVEDRTKREAYHMSLLCRGVGGVVVENRKAEEWASQLQCWCIHLLNCFANNYKEGCLDLICEPGFLRKLSSMWGGLVNDTSPAGYGLIRILCYSNYSRKSIAKLNDVVISLGNLSRSSDDWQYIGIHCLLLLLKDQDTRYKVFDTAIGFLVDLVELTYLNERSSNIGQEIINVLLSDSKKDCKFLDEVKSFVERRRKEKVMSFETLEERKVLVNLTKQQGNKCFWAGNIEEAIQKYTEGLKFCPLKLKRERVVLLSNRAQCYLVLKDANAAISDTTKALCLANPPNSHSKSLWRRSQAYDMKGLAKESLMDCIMFLSCCTKKESSTSNYVKIPYHAAQMISKQMDATWLFNSSRLKPLNSDECCNNYEDIQEDKTMKKLYKKDNDFGIGRTFKKKKICCDHKKTVVYNNKLNCVCVIHYFCFRYLCGFI